MYGKRVQEIQEEEEFEALRQEYMKKELDFIKHCELNGYKRVVIKSDGNCIFSSVSDQLYGKNYHAEIRKFVCDYIDIERDYFRPFITHPQGIDKYLEEMSKNGIWAGDIELQVLSEIYDVTIEVYDSSEQPMKVFNKDAS
jgi:OTU domain-containing protein 5